MGRGGNWVAAFRWLEVKNVRIERPLDIEVEATAGVSGRALDNNIIDGSLPSS